MNLFVNQKNYNNLASYFLRHYARLLFEGSIGKIKNGEKMQDGRQIINLRPDLNSESSLSFRILTAKFLDFINFSHLLTRWTGIWFRIKFVNIPYCVFHPLRLRDGIAYLVENSNDVDKMKLNCCRLCKYQSLCGGVPKIYLQKYGENEFRAIPDVPLQIMLEVEPHCNLNCQFCFNRNAFAQGDRSSFPSLETSLIKEIIEEIARLKIPTVRFTGGEPLLRPDIYDLLGHAKSKGLYVILNSNGILIDETVAKKLNGLVDATLISIQGTGKEGDDAVGKKGATQEKINALSNLRRFTEAEIFIATVLRPEIIEKEGSELDKIHDLIKKLGFVSRWHLCRCIPEKKEAYSENGENYKKTIDKLIDWQLGKEKFRMHYYPYVISNGIPFCFYDMERVDLVSYGGIFVDGYSRLSIDPMGNIKPIYYSPLILAGDPRAILNAWNHRFLKDLRSLKFLPSICHDCFYKRKCLGGSRFLANLVFDDYAAPDPLMPVK